jgi:hypothetical protein
VRRSKNPFQHVHGAFVQRERFIATTAEVTV